MCSPGRVWLLRCWILWTMHGFSLVHIAILTDSSFPSEPLQLLHTPQIIRLFWLWDLGDKDSSVLGIMLPPKGQKRSEAGLLSRSKRQVGNLISCETGETISAFPEKLVFSGDLTNEGRRVSSANVFKRFKVRKSHLHLLFFPLLLYCVCVVVEVVDFFFYSEKIKKGIPWWSRD